MVVRQTGEKDCLAKDISASLNWTAGERLSASLQGRRRRSTCKHARENESAREGAHEGRLKGGTNRIRTKGVRSLGTGKVDNS